MVTRVNNNCSMMIKSENVFLRSLFSLLSLVRLLLLVFILFFCHSIPSLPPSVLVLASTVCPPTDACCRPFILSNVSLIQSISDLSSFALICPSNCLSHLSEVYQISSSNQNLPLYGSGPYLGNSSICLSAYHRGLLREERGGGIKGMFYDFLSVYSTYFPADSYQSSTQNNITSNQVNIPNYINCSNIIYDNTSCHLSFLPVVWGSYIKSSSSVSGIDLSSLKGSWIVQFFGSSPFFFFFGGKRYRYHNITDDNTASQYEVEYSSIIYQSANNFDWIPVATMPFRAANIQSRLVTIVVLPTKSYAGYFITSFETDEYCGFPVCTDEVWWVTISTETLLPSFFLLNQSPDSYSFPSYSIPPNYLLERSTSPAPRCGAYFEITSPTNLFVNDSANITFNWFFGQISSNYTIQQTCVSRSTESFSSTKMNFVTNCCECYGDLIYPTTLVNRQLLLQPNVARTFNILSDSGMIELNYTNPGDRETSDNQDEYNVHDKWKFKGRMYPILIGQSSLQYYYAAGGITLIADKSTERIEESNQCQSTSTSTARLPIKGAIVHADLFVLKLPSQPFPFLEYSLYLCGSLPLPGFDEQLRRIDLSKSYQSFYYNIPRKSELIWNGTTDVFRPLSPANEHVFTAIDNGAILNSCSSQRISLVKKLRYEVPIEITISSREYWKMKREDDDALAQNQWQVPSKASEINTYSFIASYTPPLLSSIIIPQQQPTFGIPPPYTRIGPSNLQKSTIPLSSCLQTQVLLCSAPIHMENIQRQSTNSYTLPITPSSSYTIQPPLCFPPSEYAQLLGAGYSPDCPDIQPTINSSTYQVMSFKPYNPRSTCDWKCDIGYHLKPTVPYGVEEKVTLVCMNDGSWIDLSAFGVTSCVNDTLACDERCELPVPIIHSVSSSFSVSSTGRIYSGCFTNNISDTVYDCSAGALLTIRGNYFQHPLLVLVGGFTCLDVQMIDEKNETVVCSPVEEKICYDQPPCFRYTHVIQCVLPPGIGGKLPLLVQSNGLLSAPFLDAVSYAEPVLYAGCVPGCYKINSSGSFTEIDQINSCGIIQPHFNLDNISSTSYSTSLLCHSFNVTSLSHPELSILHLIAGSIGYNTPLIVVGSKECINVSSSALGNNLNYITCFFDSRHYYGSDYTVAITQQYGLGLSNQKQILKDSTVPPPFSFAFTQCPPGTEFGGFDQFERVVCNSCPPGYECNGVSTLGINSNINPICTACKPGYFASQPGIAACLQCQPGTVSALPSASTSCLSCPAGSTSDNERISCKPCPVGSISINGSSMCSECPIFTYANQSGLSKCSPCPPNSWNSEKGSGTCTVCESNSYIKLFSQLSPNSMDNYTAFSKCIDCPVGAKCLSSGIILSQEGYWVDADQNSGDPIVYPCAAPEICLPGSQCMDLNLPFQLDGNVQMMKISRLEIFSCCAPNRLPAASNLLCSKCMDGYSEWGNSCVDCSSPQYGIAVFLFIFLFLLIYCLYRLQQCESGELYATGKDSSFLRILIYHVQMASHFCRAETTWIGLLSLLSLQMTSTTLPFRICILPLSPLQHILFRAMIPIISALCLLLLFCLQILTERIATMAGVTDWSWMEWIFPTPSQWCIDISGSPQPDANSLLPFRQRIRGYFSCFSSRYRAGIEVSLSSYIRTGVYLTLFSYNTIAITTISFFSSTNVGGQTVLADIPSINTDDPEYIALIPLFYILGIFVVGGLPVILFTFLVYNREKINKIQTRLEIDRRRMPNNKKHILPSLIIPSELEPLPLHATTYSDSPGPAERGPWSQNINPTNRDPLLYKNNNDYERKINFQNPISYQRHSQSSSVGVLTPSELSFFRAYSLLFSSYTPHAFPFYQPYIILRRILLIAVTSTLFFNTIHQQQANGWATMLNFIFLLFQVVGRPHLSELDNNIELASLSVLTILTIILTIYPLPYQTIGPIIGLFFLIVLPIFALILLAVYTGCVCGCRIAYSRLKSDANSSPGIVVVSAPIINRR